MRFCLHFLLLLLLTGAVLPHRLFAAETFARLGAVDLLGDSAHDALQVALGQFDSFDENQSAVLQLEWRSGDRWGFVAPLAGLLANTDGAVMGYVGAGAEFALGWLHLIPQTGFGAYEEGDSTDLGGTFEFLSGVTLAGELSDDLLLGLRWVHISNAGLHDDNPGSNILLLQLALPL